MTKQLRLTTSDLLNSPLFKVAVGFDRMFDDLASNAGFAATGYPPYNVARISKENSEDVYEITLAVAGFTMDDIEITVENRQLKVIGTGIYDAEPVDSTVEYLHKGIAERNFSRVWRLAEHVEVENANLRDGLLRIRLVRNVPEAQKPKRITINN
jgi:molecular chaperone IbpA